MTDQPNPPGNIEPENTSSENDVPPIPVPAPEQAAAAQQPPVPPVSGYTTAGDSGATPPPPPYVAPAPPAYGAAPAYATPAYATPAPPQGLSLASLICGIGGVVLSFFSVGLLPSLAAVITGHMAVKRQPYAKGLWLTGIITGYVGILFSVIAIAFWVVLIVAAIAAGASSDNYSDF